MSPCQDCKAYTLVWLLNEFQHAIGARDLQHGKVPYFDQHDTSTDSFIGHCYICGIYRLDAPILYSRDDTIYFSAPRSYALIGLFPRATAAILITPSNYPRHQIPQAMSRTHSKPVAGRLRSHGLAFLKGQMLIGLFVGPLIDRSSSFLGLMTDCAISYCSTSIWRTSYSPPFLVLPSLPYLSG